MSNTHSRPTVRRPQTLAQAHAEYLKHGPRISSQEQRQFERGAELLRRADKIKQAETRRKQAAEKKKIKEEREREARKRMGVAEPRPHIPLSQKVLDGFCWGVKDAGVIVRRAGVDGGKDDGGKQRQTRSQEAGKKMKKDVHLGTIRTFVESGGSATTGAVVFQAIELAEAHTRTAQDPVRRHTWAHSAAYQPDSQGVAQEYDRNKTAQCLFPGNPWSDDDLDDRTLLDAVSSIGHHVQRANTSNTTFEKPTNLGHNSNVASTVTFPEAWDDFLLSSTQVEREISVESESLQSAMTPDQNQYFDPSLGTISSQELLRSVANHAQHPAPISSTTCSNNMDLRGDEDSYPPMLSRKQQDTILMPPPGLPVPRKQSSSSCRSIPYDFVPVDIGFGLSTQDLSDFA